MKKIILAGLIVIISTNLRSQHIRVRMNFPTGVSIGPSTPPPFRGAVWIGPEWQWRRGTYVHVPGYWAQPRGRRNTWVPGRWKQTRRGFIWIGGRWR